MDKTHSSEILTVSALTALIQNRLEGEFPMLWVEGEISNLKKAASGHVYFTLKDSGAQVAAVQFRGYQPGKAFTFEDGLKVIVQGRLSVYGAYGRYQIIVNRIEPAGYGALQLAYEKLKKQLSDEGLFAAERKKPLPFLPSSVGLVTSLQGAVVRDMVVVLKRRCPKINIRIYPVKVQGEGAAKEIAGAIDYFSRTQSVDVMIVGRGGGSIEDLWAFNEEVVVRAVASSTIPVVSAVGHETDITLCDFAADLRAPTPSAAAEMVVPDTRQIFISVQQYNSRLIYSLNNIIASSLKKIRLLRSRLPHPRLVQERLLQKLAHAEDRLLNATKTRLRFLRIRLLQNQQWLVSPRQRVRAEKIHIKNLEKMLGNAVLQRLKKESNRLAHSYLALKLLSPQNILNRGYAIAFDNQGRIVRRAHETSLKQNLKLRLAEGEIGVEVTKTSRGELS